jgi:hypothetical protein
LPSRNDLHPFGLGRQNGGLDVHHRAQAERRAMMLIEHYAVEVQQLLVSVDLLIDVLVEDLAPCSGSKKLFGVP